MAEASKSETMSLGLLRVAEMAKRDEKMQFFSLAHLLDQGALKRAYGRIRNDAAVGVDGVSKEHYGERLEEHLEALHQALREGRYRHQPIRRVHIPKEPGKTRPIGISTIEDKIVQNALAEVLGAIYEQDFLSCSVGFRKGRSAHDAIRTIQRTVGNGNKVQWILEADIRAYFDSISRKMLMEMLQLRIADRSLLRLIGKCLHVGVLDGAQYSEPDVGTTQGSVLSPILGNVYLHHVLDLWFEREVRPRLKGFAQLVRYADDFIIAFERKEDAESVLDQIGARMGRYGLALHPDKTRLVPFEKPPVTQGTGKGPATFDFLGFTVRWRRKRKAGWRLGFETRRKSLRKIITSIAESCRRQRHEPVRKQHTALCRQIDGHMNYFGVNGNIEALTAVVREARYLWHKWLDRRSQRGMSWERFYKLLKVWPLPTPTIRVEIWATSP
jgi:group II intron reverse transcriptase/maturase